MFLKVPEKEQNWARDLTYPGGYLHYAILVHLLLCAAQSFCLSIIPEIQMMETQEIGSLCSLNDISH